jgi:hypothetical protein
MWLRITHPLDRAQEVEDAMVQVEPKVAVDAQHSTTEFPKLRISPSPRTDNKLRRPNRKTTNPRMRLRQLMLLPLASKRKPQML